MGVSSKKKMTNDKQQIFGRPHTVQSGTHVQRLGCEARTPEPGARGTAAAERGRQATSGRGPAAPPGGAAGTGGFAASGPQRPAGVGWHAETMRLKPGVVGKPK